MVLQDGRGFIKTHRSGNTGIGKTLEDELGIEENNFPGPDGDITELKSARKNSSSMLTLFTKSPEPHGINSELLKSFGYPGKSGKLHLHTTVNALDFNTLKGETGFKIEITKGAAITKAIDEYTKNFILIPANQSTTSPLKAINIEVPRSGWEITNAIGTARTTNGNKIFFKEFTFFN